MLPGESLAKYSYSEGGERLHLVEPEEEEEEESLGRTRRHARSGHEPPPLPETEATVTADHAVAASAVAEPAHPEPVAPEPVAAVEQTPGAGDRRARSSFRSYGD